MKRDDMKKRHIFLRMVWLIILCFCSMSVGVGVDAEGPHDPCTGTPVPYSLRMPEGKTEPQVRAWEPPPPPPDTFDWVQLTSGEWLKGEFKRLYDERIEFDSDKLDLQEFDLEDVKQVRCPRMVEIHAEGSPIVEGLLHISDDTVMVTVGEKQQTFSRDKLVAIAPKGEKEADYWSGKISLGLSISGGNTEQTQYSSTVNFKRRTSKTRLMVEYLGNLTQADDVETVNNHRIQWQFDIFKNRNYFIRPVFGEYSRDPFKNIEHQVTLGGGVGYHLINTSKTEWTVAGGPACQFTRFDSVEPGEDEKQWTPALMAGTYFDTELTDSIDFILRYTFQVLDEASGTYTHHSVTTFETELTDWLDFDISFVWDRVQDPTPEDDGTVPEKDDFYSMFGLGIEF
jgi:hypothetical protein